MLSTLRGTSWWGGDGGSTVLVPHSLAPCLWSGSFGHLIYLLGYGRSPPPDLPLQSSRKIPREKIIQKAEDWFH